jgi:hypothetical protein
VLFAPTALSVPPIRSPGQPPHREHGRMQSTTWEGPDVVAASLLRAQLARLQQVDGRLAAHCAHPPAISVRAWSGPAASAHNRAAGELRARLAAAREALDLAVCQTRAALLSVGA